MRFSRDPSVIVRNVSMMIGALAALSSSLAFAAAAVLAAPPGVGVRMTLEGPVFIDAQGMSLYSSIAPCTDSKKTNLTTPISNDGDLGFAVTIAWSRSCQEKRPPLRAPADARPVGE